MDKELMLENKKCLLEEIGANFNLINSIINSIVSTHPFENPVHELSFIRNALIGISQSVGYNVGLFNQFMIFETGEIKKHTKPIGFTALYEEIEKRKADG